MSIEASYPDIKSRRTPLGETSIARTTLPELVDVLVLRAEARALLWAEQEIETIPQAVDPLQDFAVETGLVEEIGQDAVQGILSDALAPYCENEARTVPEIEQLSLGALWEKLNDPRLRPTPQTTIEAIMGSVRERGLAALKEPATKQRLSRCDLAARAQINKRIEALLNWKTS